MFISSIFGRYEGMSFEQVVVTILYTLLAVVIAISFHEWAHAYVADRLGDPTAKNMGRMSLDPTKHLDWVGLLCFVLLGIGWAKPVMINSRNLKNYRRDDILISMAGPAMNLLLSFVFFGIMYCTIDLISPDFVQTYIAIFMQIVSLNIVLAVFNILPIPPLDGFHVVSSLFIKKNYPIVAFLQRYSYIILLALIFTRVISTIVGAVSGFLLPLYANFFGMFL